MIKFNSLNRSILALTIPSIIANITTPLLGLVDTAIVGHMGSAMFIAAIALGGSVFNMLYWCFGFLRAGTSGITAQAYGAGNSEACALSLMRGLLVAAILGIVMIAISSPVANIVLRFMGADATTFTLGRQYVLIAVWGAPAVLSTYALSGWFLGIQDTKAPMTISIAVNVINIALSLTFVYVLHWGVSGLAAGTMIAQWGGVAIGILLCIRKYRRHKLGERSRVRFRTIIEWSGLRRFFCVNTDIFIRTLCLVAVTLWFTRMGAVQGTMILAVNALLMQLFMLLSYVMDGFAFAGEAIVGKSIGANDMQQVKRCVSYLLRWGTAVAALFTAVYALFGESIVGMLSSETQVVAASNEYLWWAVALPFAGFGAFTWDGIYIGATMTRRMLIAMVASILVFFITLTLTYHTMGNHGLWLSFVLYLVSRGIVSAMLWRPA